MRVYSTPFKDISGKGIFLGDTLEYENVHYCVVYDEHLGVSIKQELTGTIEQLTDEVSSKFTIIKSVLDYPID